MKIEQYTSRDLQQITDLYKECFGEVDGPIINRRIDGLKTVLDKEQALCAKERGDIVAYCVYQGLDREDGVNLINYQLQMVTGPDSKDMQNKYKKN